MNDDKQGGYPRMKNRGEISTFAVCLVLLLSPVLGGCATYMGYHYEGYEDGPKETKAIGDVVSEVELSVSEKPSKSSPRIALEAKRTQTTLMETTWTRKRVRADKYLPYSVFHDLGVEPMATGLCLAGPLGDLPTVLTGRAGAAMHTNTSYDENPPIRSHRWLHWFGWFLPFINANVAPREGQVFYVRRLVEADDPIRSEQYTKTEMSKLDSVPIRLDLGPAGMATVTTDVSGRGQFDLAPYLNQLRRDTNWTITASLKNYDTSDELELTYNTSDLGVTWSEPRVQPGNPPRLSVELALSDTGGDAVLEAGESAEARLTVRNIGDVTAWDLRTRWQTPPSSPNKLIVGRPSAASRDRLEPGESWETRVDLQAAPEWTWDGELSVRARVEELSGREHPEPSATIATVDFEPPRLELVRWTWFDGENGVLEPGDNVTLNLWVQNIGLSEARDVRVVLRSSDTALRVGEFSKAVLLRPSELGRSVWNLEVPEGWTSPEGVSSKELPIEVVLEEARPRFSVAEGSLGLALGARSSVMSSSEEAVELAQIQQEAQDVIAAERQANKLRADLAKRRRAVEQSQQEFVRMKQELEGQMAALRAEQAQEREDIQGRIAALAQEHSKILAEVQRDLEEERRRLAEVEREKQARRAKLLEAQTERNVLRRRSYAVIVGVDEYQDPDIGRLQFACADARALRDALTDPQTGLFASENVTLLTTGARDPALVPERLNVLQAVAGLKSRLRPDDRLLFFFAGHGSTDEKGVGNYLLPQDVTLETVSLQGIKLREEILNVLEGCPARDQVVIIDACHSGLREGMRADDAQSRAVVVQGIGDALTKFGQNRSGRAVICSSSRDQLSNEDKQLRHGVFTYYLVEGLRALAGDQMSTVDSDLNGRVEASELFEHVAQSVDNWCREKGRPPQTPRSQYDDAGANISLATKPQEE